MEGFERPPITVGGFAGCVGGIDVFESMEGVAGACVVLAGAGRAAWSGPRLIAFGCGVEEDEGKVVCTGCWSNENEAGERMHESSIRDG